MIHFRNFQEKDLSQFRKWLKQDHVKLFWQESENDDELREKFLVKLPQRGIHAFIIEHENAQIGYIQYYEASRVGGGYWTKEAPGTFGIDILIGEKKHIGKGIGQRVVKNFVDLILSNEVGVTSLIIDPDPKNISAIKSFEKAGFQKESIILTPGGEALLMRINIV